MGSKNKHIAAQTDAKSKTMANTHHTKFAFEPAAYFHSVNDDKESMMGLSEVSCHDKPVKPKKRSHKAPRLWPFKKAMKKMKAASSRHPSYAHDNNAFISGTADDHFAVPITGYSSERMTDLIEVSQAAGNPLMMEVDMMEPTLSMFLDRLPRELRDEIYEHTLIAVQVQETIKPEDEPNPVVKASIEQTACLNVLLLNRQINKEYRDLVERKATMVLADHENYKFKPPVFPAVATTVRHLELLLFIFCACCDHKGLDIFCRAATEIRSHLDWITKAIAQLPQLRDVRVKFQMQCCPCSASSSGLLSSNSSIKDALEKFVRLSKLSRLELVPYDHNINETFEGPKFLRVVWSPKEGLVETQGVRHSKKALCLTS